MTGNAKVIDELRAPTKDLAANVHDTSGAFTKLHMAAMADAALPAVTKELMALAGGGHRGRAAHGRRAGDRLRAARLGRVLRVRDRGGGGMSSSPEPQIGQMGPSALVGTRARP